MVRFGRTRRVRRGRGGSYTIGGGRGLRRDRDEPAAQYRTSRDSPLEQAEAQLFREMNAIGRLPSPIPTADLSRAILRCPARLASVADRSPLKAERVVKLQ